MLGINVQNITKFYGSQKVLDAVSLEVKKGEVTGLLGPNGAGKTTLMKIITSFLVPDNGKVFVENLDVQEYALQIRKKIGYLPENNPLYTEMYVREYLLYVLKLYHLDIPAKKRLSEVIELTGLGEEQHKKIGELSKGYRQRVGLAQALIHNPSVLILDEPTTGLDPNQLSGIRSVIISLAKEKAVLLSTHIMQEVEAVCNRVVIINKGKVVANDQVELLARESATGNRFFVELEEKISDERFREIYDVAFVKKISETGWVLYSRSQKDLRPEIFSWVVANQLHLISLAKHNEKLEDVFRNLTNL